MMEFDWNLCVICQEKTTESLKCPLNTHDPRCDKADAYSSFLSNVAQFQAIGALPVKLQFACNVEDFVTNSASWHKSCHLKFNNSKLAKAKKRHSTTEDTETTKRTCKREPLRPRSHLPRQPWGLQNLRPLAILGRPQYFHGHTM